MNGYIFFILKNICNQPIRPISSVVLDDKTKKELLKNIDIFLSKEQWYLENGIPYQFGILLYGPPGTGKTGVIRAVSSYLKRDLYMGDLSLGTDIVGMFQSLPEKSVLALEDVDAFKATSSREEDDDDK